MVKITVSCGISSQSLAEKFGITGQILRKAG